MSGKTPGSDRRPTAQSRRREVVEEYTPEERSAGRYVRTAYVVNRSAFESAKRGVEMVYQVPKLYDGVTKASLDPQDANKKAKNVWFEMARWCIRWKVEPVSFVQYVFTRLDIRDRVPEPFQVCSDAHVKGFREFVTKGVVEAIGTAFETQTRTAQAAFISYHNAFAALDPERAKGKKWTIAENVILDFALPLTPLFRYLLALSSARDAAAEGDEPAKYRFLEFARDLFDRATVQFWAHRDAYTEHWSRWLPKAFPAQAEARFRKIAFNEATSDDDPVAE